jgi:hypothetical protein
VVGVGGIALAGELGALTRSGAPRVIFAPKDTSGRIGKSVPECDDSEGECEGEGDVDGVDVRVEGEWDLEDVGVDGVRDDVEGERDGLEEESDKPGRSELLPSSLSASRPIL